MFTTTILLILALPQPPPNILALLTLCDMYIHLTLIRVGISYPLVIFPADFLIWLMSDKRGYWTKCSSQLSTDVKYLFLTRGLY